MHVASIDIKNFRSLEELHVDLQPGFNAIVGRNNTGKTNLLEAIRLALGPAASRGDSLWLERDDFYRASAAATPAASLSITLTFEGLSEAQRAHFYEIVEFDLTDMSKSKATVRYEASWPAHDRYATIKRSGGPVTAEAPEVPTAILSSLPITFLPALRNAEEALAPGHKSRLAKLLDELLARQEQTTRDDFVNIFQTANDRLLQQQTVSNVQTSLQSSTRRLAGSDHVESAVAATDVKLDRILRSLQVQMLGNPIASLDANGLGYNNLLYMAVVFEHLKHQSENECPLLLVEEPEAHLHPQLTLLLAEYFSVPGTDGYLPQALVTTHSPTMAASVSPKAIHVLFTDVSRKPRCNSLSKAGMTQDEEEELQRMLDVTRASLYFAKGVILVEGICEALLVPVLAKRLGYDLAKAHISVIPICGVAFETFSKLLTPTALGIPVAILSDADPKVTNGSSWESDQAEVREGAFVQCDRMQQLLSLFQGHATVKAFSSKLTLEYDLAESGDGNAALMATVWESCFPSGRPGTFNTERLAAATTRGDKALITWRGICRASHSGSKAQLAHRLAAKLAVTDPATRRYVHEFVVPDYIKVAVEHVASALGVRPETQGVTT